MLLFFAGVAPDVMKHDGRQLGEAAAGRGRRCAAAAGHGAGSALGARGGHGPPQRRSTPASISRSAAARRVVPNGVLGMLIFVVTEVMLFAGLISAHTIMQARPSAVGWPPPGQPRLPVEETAINTAALLAERRRRCSSRSARFRRDRARARSAARRRRCALGAFFVRASRASSGSALIARGPHAHLEHPRRVLLPDRRHARAARGRGARRPRLGTCVAPAARAGSPQRQLAAAAVFWYFVVGLWPVLYWRVYL